MTSNQRGFTIIEVILFLAISGMLLAIAIATITTNINNSRFNDAIRSTTSYLQGQYSAVAAGQSDRDTGTGCDASGAITNSPTAAGMSNCVIMGRFIKLEGSTFTERYITGHRTTLNGISADDTTAINQMNPVVAGSVAYEGEYNVPWGMGLVNTTLPSGVSQSTGLAIIRSPASGNILYYTQSNVLSAEPTLSIVDANLSKSAVLCFADDGGARVGRINIATGQGQEVIQTDLANTGSCP